MAAYLLVVLAVTLVAPQFLRRVATSPSWTAAAADRDRLLARSGDGSTA